MKATLQGEVIAESDQTLEVGGYRYFPRDTVRMERLRPTPRTEDDLACPHGVQFFDVTGSRDCAVRAAWSYEAPGPSMQRVGQWIGFWNEVEVT